MIPAAFRYAAVRSVGEAVDLLGAHSDAKVLAGGHSLLPLMKLRLAIAVGPGRHQPHPRSGLHP